MYIRGKTLCSTFKGLQITWPKERWYKVFMEIHSRHIFQKDRITPNVKPKTNYCINKKRLINRITHPDISCCYCSRIQTQGNICSGSLQQCWCSRDYSHHCWKCTHLYLSYKKWRKHIKITCCFARRKTREAYSTEFHFLHYPLITIFFK